MINCVWPVQFSYPEFNHPNVSEYWGNFVKELHDLIQFDGLWLDMNEPSAFVNGEILSSTQQTFLGDYSTISKNFSILTNFLAKTQKAAPVISKGYPYLPGGHYMNDKTISENAYHENHGAFIDQELPLTEIDFHSINGFLETKVTYDALKNKVGQLQPIIIARSTAFGGGNFTSHWTVNE